MRALHCPRCHREVGDPLAAFCRACGAPLRLAEEPSPSPLSSPIGIDRRDDAADLGRTRSGAEPRPEPRAPPPPRDDLADVEKSVWDLGPLLPSRPEPSPTPAAAVPPRRAPPPVPPSRATPAGPPPPPTAPAPGVTIVYPPSRPAPPPAPAAAVPAPAASVQVRRGAGAPPRRSPSGVVEVHVRRAQPWRRVAAWAIDALPFLAGAGALVRWSVRAAGAAEAGGIDLLDFVARERVIVLSVAAVTALALAVYATLAHALAGATLGKRVLGLRVVGPDGERPGLARSAVRSGLALVSAAALGLGFLLALFTPSGRALHDLVARTWVVEG